MQIKTIGKWISQIVQSKQNSVYCILFITCLCFSNIFLNPFINTDYDFIVNWDLIQDLSNFYHYFVDYIPPDIQTNEYTPLRTVFFALNFSLWEHSPLGYHLISLLIHLMGTWLVYQISLSLTRNKAIAFMAGLFFGIHPVHVESVTPMAGSLDTLGIIFAFFSFYYYIHSSDPGNSLVIADSFSKGKGKKKIDVTEFLPQKKSLCYSGAIVFAGLAIFTNELAITLPVLFLFYDYFFEEEERSLKSFVLRLLPFVAMIFFYLSLKWIVMGGLTQATYLYDSKFLTILVGIKSWAKYLGLSLFPFILTHNHIIAPGIYSYGPVDFDAYAVLSQSILDPLTLASLIVVACVVLVGFFSYKKYPLVSFCLGWFFICLLPVSGFFPLSLYFSEKYLYPGSFAFCLLLSFCFYQMFVYFFKEKAGSGGQKLCVTLMVVLTCFYAGRTFIRNSDFHSPVVFYEKAVAANPQSVSLLSDLGVTYHREARFNESIMTFQKAIQINPDDAHLYYSMEKSYSALQQYEDSKRALLKAIELNPSFAEAYYNLAGLHLHLEKPDESDYYLKKSIALYKEQGRVLEAGDLLKRFQDYLQLKQMFLDQVIPNLEE